MDQLTGGLQSLEILAQVVEGHRYSLHFVFVFGLYAGGRCGATA